MNKDSKPKTIKFVKFGEIPKEPEKQMPESLQDFYSKEILRIVEPGPFANAEPSATKKRLWQRVRDWIIDKIREKVGYYDE